ncbi:MAG: T9SS type A sorting domain-containing protein [Bacteroidota bacterium]
MRFTSLSLNSTIRRSASCTKNLSVILVMLLLLAATGHAAIFTSVTSGNWHVGATWGGSTYPTAADDVIIATGTTVTISSAADAVCGALTVNGTLNVSSSTASNPLTCSDVEISGILNCDIGLLKQLAVVGTVVIALNGTISQLSGTIWAESWENNGTFSAAAGTRVQISANSSSGQTISNGGSNGFKQLLISGGGTILALSAIEVTEALGIISGATFDMGSQTLSGLTDLTNQTSGSGILKTINNSATPIPYVQSSKYSFAVDYAGGSQTIVASDYTTLSVSGSGTKTLSGDVKVSDQLNLSVNGCVRLGVSGGYNLTLGTDGSSPGTLTYSSGHIYGHSGAFIRYFDGSVFGFGDLSGYFPLGDSVFVRSVSISTANTNPLQNLAGAIGISHNPETGFTDIAGFIDDGSLINRRHDMSWSISTYEGLVMSGIDMYIVAEGIVGVATLSELRAIRETDVVGTNSPALGTLTYPVVFRLGLNADGSNTAGLTNTIMNTFYIGSNSGANPLPVELTSFSARLQDNMVDLRWKTATELNNYGFEVQRNTSADASFDEDGWMSIGFVNGSGTSMSPKSYSFADPLVDGSKLIRYRLMQVDRDGTTDYSSIVEVVPGAVNFNLSQNYPNPFQAQTTIAYSLNAENQVSLKVYDVLGNVVETLTEEFQSPGSYVRQFDPARMNLKPGLYMVSLTAGGKVQNKTMMYLP